MGKLENHYTCSNCKQIMQPGNNILVSLQCANVKTKDDSRVEMKVLNTFIMEDKRKFPLSFVFSIDLNEMCRTQSQLQHKTIAFQITIFNDNNLLITLFYKNKRNGKKKNEKKKERKKPKKCCFDLVKAMLIICALFHLFCCLFLDHTRYVYK